MAIPSTVEATAAGYIGYLGSQINLAEKLWTHYAWVVSAAYAAPYELNKRVLDKVEQAQEAQRRADHDRMAFALSLLTVAVEGAVACATARFFSIKSAKPEKTQ